MNDRQKELLSLLLRESAPVYRVEELSLQLQCSEKTIRNDFNKLEQFLTQYEDAVLIRKPGTGIKLQINKQTQAKIFQDLYQVHSQTTEERIIEIAYHLLMSTKAITLTRLAEHYYTHSNDIKMNLNLIAEWLHRFNLEMDTRQGVGSIVRGEELNKRSALAHLSELVAEQQERDVVLDFFPIHERNAVKKVIQDMKMEYDLELTDGDFVSLLIHALIMIRRTRQNSPIAISNQEIEETLGTKEYQMTSDFLGKLTDILRIQFPENEAVYFAWHIASSIRKKDSPETLAYSNTYVEKLSEELIQKIGDLTLVSFKDDRVLLDGLMIHMDAVIKRLTYGFHITNPMMIDIKKMYPYLFSMVVFVLNDIRDNYKVRIPEEEAAYLVLHFQASIERMEKQTASPQRALIICHMGLGMSRLLQAKLEQQYKGLTVVDCIAKHQMRSFLKHHDDIDLIISTVPITQEAIPYVLISPLLTGDDKVKLNQWLKKDFKMTEKQSFPVLHDFLSKGFFQKDVKLEHPFEIVERLASQLVQLDIVEAAFIHSALLRERASATSIGGKIAIPHAEPGTVKESKLMVATTSHEIEWGREWVSIVFLFAIKPEDRLMTKDLIKDIVNLSEQPRLVEAITTAKDKETILNLLE